MNVKMESVTRPGRVSGRITFQNNRHRLAPSMLAASSSAPGIPSMNCRNRKQPNAVKAAGRIRPGSNTADREVDAGRRRVAARRPRYYTATSTTRTYIFPKISLLLASSLVAFTLAAPASADLVLCTPFSNDMMVQADRPVSVWGTDNPGTVVTVTVGTERQSATADGDWRLELGTFYAGASLEIVVATDDETITLTNVLAGDIWLCSGQSNMAWTVNNSDAPEQVLAEAANAKVRLLTLPQTSQDEPVEVVEAVWAEASPRSVRDFWAVGYYFGRMLERERAGRSA